MKNLHIKFFTVTLGLSLCWLASISLSRQTSAQEWQKTAADQRVSPGQGKEVYPLGPLDRNDPRAIADPALLSVNPMPEPPNAVITDTDNETEANSVVSLNMVTHKETQTRSLWASGDNNQFNLSSSNDKTMPGNVGSTDDDETDNPQPERILGADNRRILSPTTTFARSAMSKLYVTFPNGITYNCSASIVGSKYALTSGHCVYSHTDGGWASKVIVIPGMDGSYLPYGTVNAVYLRTYDKWVYNRDTRFDMALLTLDRKVGLVTGWFGLGYFSSINRVRGHIGGYPADKTWGVKLHYDNDLVTDSNTYRVYYRIDTSPGQSGSGVYRKLNNDRFIFAVHGYSGVSANQGIRISLSKFLDLQEWIYSGY